MKGSLTLSKLPAGPTAHFRLTSAQLSREISGHAAPTPHAPELVLSNMSTPLGLSVGRLLQSLFPPLPQLQGRQVVAVHNQRDFIFFRRFRYMFELRESELGIARAKERGMDEQVRAKMQEIGPRLTLKLRWIKKGTLASGRLRANGRLIGADRNDDTNKDGEEQEESDGEADAVIDDDAADQLEKDTPVITSNEHHDIPQVDASALATLADIADRSTEDHPAASSEKAQSSKRKRKATDIRIPKSQYEERQSYQHRVKKPKAGGSILDSVNLQGGVQDKQKEWLWKPKMQIKKNRFAL